MKDGGSAFPIFDEVTGKIFPGMTLRDYFAGQALAGLATQASDVLYVKGYANIAYAMADAMLAEKEKRNGKDSD